VTLADVTKFFVDFIENDQLGRIANAHVAISDHSPDGVNDLRAIELAEKFSEAVDFPKTGVMAVIRPELVKNLKYPDFMEKRFGAYESQKVIGVLYRQCKNMLIGGGGSGKPFHLNDSVELNRSFLYPGYEAFLAEAEEAYLIYRAEIERIMSLVGCTLESELLIGFCMTSSRSEEARDFNTLSSIMVKKLCKQMRKEHFFKVFNFFIV
jgi:hypothetical protein